MQDVIKIKSKQHSNVVMRAIPGHFVTPNSHVNYYLDETALKTRLSEASATAKALSSQIAADTIVDTIVCIDGCEVIAAFMADELTKAGIFSMNAHKTIYIVTPEYVNSGQMVFRENFHPMIKGKNVLILMAAATTGQTVMKATQTLRYYGANLTGISAIFSAANSMAGMPIRSLFSISDLPEYKAYDPEGCSMCRENKAIDAFANSYGYSRIH